MTNNNEWIDELLDNVTSADPDRVDVFNKAVKEAKQAITQKLQEVERLADTKARIEELDTRKEANTKLRKLLTDTEKEALNAQGLTPSEVQVVRMMLSKIRRHYQEAERQRILESRKRLEAQLNSQ